MSTDDTRTPAVECEPPKLRDGYEWLANGAYWNAGIFNGRVPMPVCGIDCDGDLWMREDAPVDVVLAVIRANDPDIDAVFTERDRLQLALINVDAERMMTLVERDRLATEVAALRTEIARRDARRFPIMRVPEYAPFGCPASIPWSAIEDFAKSANDNHGQTLERLAARGGLSACEAVAVIEGRRWHRMEPGDAVRRLRELTAPRPAAPEGGPTL